MSMEISKKETTARWHHSIELTALIMGNGVAFEHVRFLSSVATGIDTTGEYYALFGWTRASLKRAVDRLVRDGFLVTNTIDGSKGRRLCLTEKACSFLDDMCDVLNGTTRPSGSASQIEKYARASDEG